jgi:hypothetical protein
MWLRISWIAVTAVDAPDTAAVMRGVGAERAIGRAAALEFLAMIVLLRVTLR